MNAFTGTGALVRLILRRDRVLMPIWALFMSLLPLSLASGTAGLYPTDEARQGYIDDLSSSSLLIMFYGRSPDPSLGSLIFWRSATGMVIMALIGLLTVIRHTRVEEEAGRRELVGSAVVGRHANLAAALVATAGASLVVGVLVALGMMSQGTPATGRSPWAWPGQPRGSPSRQSGRAPLSSARAPARHEASASRSSPSPSPCAPLATWLLSRAAACPGCRGCRRSAGSIRCRHMTPTGGGYLRSLLRW